MRINKICLYVMMGLMAISLAGCGSTGGGSDTPAGDVNPYVGTASLSGSVAITAADAASVANDSAASSVRVNSVARTASFRAMGAQIASQMDKVTVKPLMAAVQSTDQFVAGLPGTAYAKLYVLNAEGNRVYTGFSCTIEPNISTYSFEGILDGQTYVVEILKEGYDDSGNHRMLKMQALAIVDEGAVTADADVSPFTQYIVDTIMTEVIAAAEDANIDRDTIEFFVRIFTDQLVELINDGTLQVNIATPYDETAFEDVDQGTEQEAEITDQDKQIMEELNNNESAFYTLELTKLKAKYADGDLTAIEAKEFIKTVLGVKSESSQGSGEKGGNVPDFFIDAFVRAYQDGVTTNAFLMANALRANIMSPTVSMMNTTQNIIDQLVNSANAALTELYTMYDYLEAHPEEATVNVDIPLAVQVLFPMGIDQPVINATTELDVPKALILMNVSGIMDLPPNYTQQMLDMMNGPYFNPLGYCYMLHILTVADLLKPQFMFVKVSSVQCGKQNPDNNNNWEPVRALMAECNIMIPGVATVNHVVLEYPIAGGDTATAAVGVFQMGISGQMNISGAVNPVAVQLLSAGLAQARAQAAQVQSGEGEATNVNYSNTPWSDSVTYGDLIKDFVAGAAYLKVYADAAETQLVLVATQNIIIPNIGMIQWLYPSGPSMSIVAAQGYDQNHQPMIIPDNGAGQAYPVFQWEAPAGTIPEGYELRYAVNLNLNAQPLNMGPMLNLDTALDATDYEWENPEADWPWCNIWNTWQTGRFLSGTTMSLPFPLQALNLTSVPDNYRIMYNINVTPVLIKKDTGEVAWEGYNSGTQFNVGDVNWAVTINGEVIFPTLENLTTRYGNGQGGTVTGSWKVGLFVDGSQSGSGWQPVFWDNLDTDPRYPIAMDSKALAALGDMAACAGETRQFTFVIDKGDDLLQSGTEYFMVVWYDVDEAAPWWPAGVVDPITNGLVVTTNVQPWGTYLQTLEGMYDAGYGIRNRNGIIDWNQRIWNGEHGILNDPRVNKVFTVDLSNMQ